MSYNNSSQYPSSGYQSAYTQYPQSYGSNYNNYQGYGQYANQPAQQSTPTEGFSSSSNWNSSGYGSTQKDAVAQEMQQQKAQLTKQREDYVKKALVLRHELDQLRVQKHELVGDGRCDDHELANILRQNDKLQDEIQGKMKAIHNVIEMLSSIIKDNRSIADLEASLREPESPKRSPREETRSEHKSKSPEAAPNDHDKYCYVHYDTGLHWCRLCDEFPETAKDFLLHLQDKKHRELAKENDVDNTPWHKLPAEPVLPSNEEAPKRRIPIKGLQFFISAPSWYCKLCDVWIGDLHCASHHLKSQSHFQNYENFVSQNPQWEMEWFKDREKTMVRKVQQEDSSDSDSSKRRKKRKDKRHSSEPFAKDKKKKKKSKKKRRHSSDSSSSSSSDSSSEDENEDKSRSIRVAMRNMKQVQSIMDEDLSAKWNVLEKLVEEHKKKELRDKEEQEKKDAPEDPLINQWMTVSQPPPKDKQMLDNLKDRMRLKQEQERARLAEMEQRRREKEREELERLEQRKQEEREAAEEAERERKRRDQDEMDRIRDKERNQVRFKTNYRRRRSRSRSDDEENHQDRYHRHESSSRYRKENEPRSYKERVSRSRSRSPERKPDQPSAGKKKPPGPPSYKKLPFIGRMPLFKNRTKAPEEKDQETKEIKKQSYEAPRRTRFEPGNLPRAFIPRPDVVCFPKLSSIPPLDLPPPPPPAVTAAPVLAAPKVAVEKRKEQVPKAPPPPTLVAATEEKPMNLSDDEALYGPGGIDPSIYYQDYQNSMYPQHDVYSYETTDEPVPPPPPPHPHGLPLEPPPLPPDDDLALLGICADDMAAQSF
ncbi:unnamed protein product [Phaedon cochleariae]|uniref:U1-type domain-containing protein n=1 Tax=Phaedon cochleariae TaxID=80249 RepID=A0A9N9SKE9_PHACE|nr:unnamed protein product [Phaedon cochleariae]